MFQCFAVIFAYKDECDEIQTIERTVVVETKGEVRASDIIGKAILTLETDDRDALSSFEYEAHICPFQRP